MEYSPQRPLKEFDPESVEAFTDAIRMGMSVDVACVRAGIATSELADLYASQPEGWAERLRLESLKPLSEVAKRMRGIMLSANDPDSPLPFRDALTIMERLAPEVWKEKRAVDVTTNGKDLPTPILGGLTRE